MSDESSVLVRTEGRIGRITLNRPKAINALTHEMVTAIHAALREWADDDAVEAVLLDGAGERGLCAGQADSNHRCRRGTGSGRRGDAGRSRPRNAGLGGTSKL